jgi:glycosyltransferase involved in cell wall biosynthesis
MRIAFICGFALEPKGTVRLRTIPLAEELVKLGHEVTIFLTPYDNCLYSGREWDQEGVHVVNATISRHRWRYPGAIIELIGAVRAFRPDILHVFKPKGFGGVAAEIMLKMSKTPVILDCDDWEGWGGWNEVKNYPWIIKQCIDWEERHLIRLAHGVTAASRVLSKRAIEIRGSDAHTWYLPNCISGRSLQQIEEVRSLGKDRLRSEMNLPDRPLVLYVGHFEAGDDTEFFARAGADSARVTGASLVFVGTGQEEESIRKFIAGMPDVDAHFFGQIPYEKYLRLLAACDIAAFPYPDTPIYRAKCSVRIVEFLAMGATVVTSAVGQNTEYIEDGVNGRLSLPGDLPMFARILTELIHDESARKTMSDRAHKRVRERHVWDQTSGLACDSIYMTFIGLSH